MKEFIEELDQTTKVIGVGLIVSILLNIGLGVYAMSSGGVFDNYDGSAATDVSFYEEQAEQLAARNEALEAQLAEMTAAQQAAEEEAVPTPGEEVLEDTSGSGATNTDNNDAVRNSVREATLGFMDAFINVNSAEETYADRRERLDPYTTQEIASRIAPTPEELAEMGIESGHDEGVVEEDAYTFERELTGLQVFFDEASLNTSTAQVIANTVTDVSDSLGADSEERERYTITLTQEGDSWVVSEYVLDVIN